MSRERLARKRMLGVSVIEVSEAPLDVEGLRERWLGKALLPDLTKEGVVRCVERVRGSGDRVTTRVFTWWLFREGRCLEYYAACAARYLSYITKPST